MRHRHLTPGAADSPAAVEDILDRGTVADWRVLAGQVRGDLHGRAAESLRQILRHRHMYGTTNLWNDYLANLELQARTGLPNGADGKT